MGPAEQIEILEDSTALPIEQQRFLAFEGLLAWAKAVVLQADRIAAAEDLRRTKMDEFFAAVRQRNQAKSPMRGLQHTWLAERHLYCLAAGQLFDHRSWIGDLGLLDRQLFAGIDPFASDARAMRNFNEHAIEYFRGNGRFPAKWKRHGEVYNSDPTGTNGTLIGGCLDWQKLAEATNALLETLADQPPFYPSSQ